MSDKRVAMHIKLSPALAKRIREMVKLADLPTMTEFTRRAFAVYEECIMTEKEGGKVLIENADGEKTRLRINW